MGFTDRKKILLVYPGKLGEFKPEIPLSLLYLASVLRDNGYTCEIFDMRLQDLGKCDLSRILCVGITSMSGPMIGDGLRLAQAVRSYDENIPIIWGGVHPSLLPEQTVESSLVDIVVRAEGEQTFRELVQSLDSDNPIEKVRGITFQKAGAAVSTPNRPFIDMNTLATELPYDLLEMDRYELSAFPIHTGRGCPGHCTFCYNQSYNRGSYRCKSSEKVLQEVDAIVNHYSVNRLSFVPEDDFFVSKNRVEKICNGLIERGYGIEWYAYSRFDTIYRYSEDLIKLLEKSGCNLLFLGGESGSQEILDKVLEKGITVEQMLEVTRKMSRTAIAQAVSFMSGVPTETDEDLSMTMSLIDEMASINPNMRVSGFQIFVPYPGTRLFDLVKNEYGFKPPDSLEDWANYKLFRDVNCTWLSKKKARQLKGITTMARFPFRGQRYQVPERYREFPYSQVYAALTRLARWRWKHRFFRLPLEWILVEKVVERNRGWV